MGKLKKWNLSNSFFKKIKYPYLVKIHNLPLDNKIAGYQFKKNADDTLSFYTSKRTYEYLNNQNVLVESNFIAKKNNLKKLFFRKWLSIVSLIIIFLILLFSKNYIRKIEFTNNVYYSKDVLDAVYENLTDKKVYYSLNGSLNDISKKLRSRFPYYEWIGLRKDGSVLYIDIVDLEPILIINPRREYGNLVASKSAYIVNFHINEGLLVVNVNMTVRKGDLLVSGNLNYLMENVPVKESYPSGYVNGKTFEVIEVLVPKKEEKIIYTGNLKSNNKIAFTKNVSKSKAPFSDYYYQTETIFKLGPLRLLRETFFEKKTVTTRYDLASAIDFAKLKVESDFYHTARNEYEQVVKMDVLTTKEEQNHYLISLIVCKIENIALFQPINAS